MTRKLKVLGLALVAVLALSAIVASAASASKLTADGPVTLLGTQTGEANANSWVMLGKTVTCPSTTYTGHKAGSTTEKITSGSESAQITPHFGTCVTNTGGFPTTIDMNGCVYTLDIGASLGNDEYTVTTTLHCPVGQHIVWTLFTSAAGHTESKPFCHLKFTDRTTFTGLVAKDTTNGTIDISGTLKEFEIDKETISGTTTDVGILCPKETTKTGERKIDISVKDTSGTAISLS